MSGTHEGCSQGKCVRDREGSKHSTAATLERVDSEAAVLPQDFEVRGYGACEAAVGVVQKSVAKDDSSRSGTLTFNMTHASERGAAMEREAKQGVHQRGSTAPGERVPPSSLRAFPPRVGAPLLNESFSTPSQAQVPN